MLKIVTITGADDSIRPEQLLQLSKAYPFVEWAILLSRNSQGKPRFPSLPWLNELAELKRKNPDLKLAGHLCGAYVKELLKGEIDFALEVGRFEIFERVQINTHGQPHSFRSLELIEALNIWPAKEFIFQYDNVNPGPLKAASEAGVKCSALFDLSHGAGILPESWPKPLPGIKCGYAGGIGPDNIEGQIAVIERICGDIETWVDMETKVRSADDQIFDLVKVERCLKISQKNVLGASLRETLNVVNSGYAGVNQKGNIVDRRKEPSAIAMQKNVLLGIPEPKQLPGIEKEGIFGHGKAYDIEVTKGHNKGYTGIAIFHNIGQIFTTPNGINLQLDEVVVFGPAGQEGGEI